MPVQAIIRKKTSVTVTFFGGKPGKETTKALSDSGLTFYGQSKQWHSADEVETIVDESKVAEAFKR